jgi:hypothetical protein
VTDSVVAQDNLGVAEAASEAILSFPSTTEMILGVARASLAVMAVRRGDAAAARWLYPALQAARDTFIYEAMAGDRLLGLLAVVMGEHDTAVKQFESALTFCRNSGCEPELAWTCHDLADLLGARRQPGDDDRAAALRDTALTIARRLGMQPLVGRVLSHR